MGTSSSNGGPSGSSSLLPSWYPSTGAGMGGNGGAGDDGDSGGKNEADGSAEGSKNNQGQDTGNQGSQKQPTPTTSKSWTNAKGAFTRFTRNTAGSGLGKAGRSYVRTLGGARGATRSATRGMSVGGGFGGVLASVATRGINATLTSLGLTNYVGRSSEEILARLADAIAPIGATNDEAIARDALIATLDLIYTKIVENGGDLAALETLTPEMIKDAVIAYVSIYIFKKWVYELGIAVERNTVTERQAVEMEIEIKEFISAEVRLAMQDKPIRDFDLNTADNQQTIEAIFQNAYSTLEQ